VQVDVDVFPARDGDVFMICSDGLTSMVHEPRLKPLLTTGGPLEEIGRALIAAANEAGGRDNITVVLFRLEDVGGDAAVAAVADEDTSEYETFEGEAVAPRQGVSRPHALAQPTASDAAEAEYRASGTVALSAVRPRAEPVAESAPPARPAPKRRRRGLRAGPVIALLVVVVVLIALWQATRAVYFLGTDPSLANTVTVYRGLPYELPLGIRLYTPVEGSGVTIATVPAARRKTFTDHRLRSEKDAENLLHALEKGQLR
jgi:PPM family protein phosphatase